MFSARDAENRAPDGSPLRRSGRHTRPDGEPSPWFTAPSLPEWTPPGGFPGPLGEHPLTNADSDTHPPAAFSQTLASGATGEDRPGDDSDEVSEPGGHAWSSAPASPPSPPHHVGSAVGSLSALKSADSSPDVPPSAQTAPAEERPSGAPPRLDSPAASDMAIDVNGLQKKFKDTVAVESVSFSVPKGSIVALLGPNGAGKTTTVNMLCTLLSPDGGSATVAGHDVVKDAPSVRRSIMLTGQFAALDESLTGRENLVLFGRLLGLKKGPAEAKAAELLEQFGLSAAANRRVREYSGGMRRRIDIACGLVTMPEVVFLDEPTTGLDPRSRQEVWSLVNGLRERGVTTLLTTQYLEEADALSDRIVVIDRGRVIAEGTSDELKEQTGASYCQVTPQHFQDLARLKDILADMLGPSRTPTPRLPLIDSDDTGGFTALTDDAKGELSVAVPAPNGAETLVEVVRRTTASGIELSDIALRRPSLDEVFLTLTDPGRGDRAS
ncbi:ATP-binding cassette domain-containing protein [Gordonia amicalis]|uniref:ATP-binding cassette domain-containing protein n=1 Tax=Gordonia amicalis TaxID=89053 RepID=UPI0022A7A302|nr:ATP-binding cassette domain-containing protein [Gordonia amicalis]MCZ0914458.1 ATP-binding cassette domain-containing protein [Gordonia amicalis]